MQPNLQLPQIQEISDPDFEKSGSLFYVLRDDLIHPFLSGNKWRKLKYNLEDFHHANKKIMVTFGGAFSNHLVAVAAAGKIFGFKTIGIMRGDEPMENPYIAFMKRCGMTLIPVSRSQYRWRNDPLKIEFFHEMVRSYQQSDSLKDEDYYYLPEGGSNEKAVLGCLEITGDIPFKPDYICCACGTGATLAGISKSLNGTTKAIGIPVLRSVAFMENQIRAFGAGSNFEIIHDYHFGGYGKRPASLLNFCNSFSQQTGIPLEPVYTGKLVFGILDLARKEYFKQGSKVVLVHTGGIFNFDADLS